MKQRRFVTIIIFLMVFVIVISSCAQNIQRECTAEAKLCPDGSSVGRVGPNCEFAPCPSKKGWVK